MSNSGDVVGPASSTDNAVARFDGTTGKLLKDSLVTVSDAGALVSPAFDGTASVFVFQHDPTILGTVGPDPGDTGGFKFGFTYQGGPWTNGPVGEVDYIDDVWRFGSNVGEGSDYRDDSTKASLLLTFESRYYQSGVFGSEFHVEGTQADGLGAYRPFSIFAAHDGSVVSGLFTGDLFNFFDAAGAPKIKFDVEHNVAYFFGQSVRIDTTDMAFGSGVAILSEDANQPTLRLNDTGHNALAMFRLAGGSSELVQLGGHSGITRLMIGTDCIGSAANAYLDMRATAVGLMNGGFVIGATSMHASALFEVVSTTKGVRFPNMTTTQKNAISSPAAGLVVFDTTLGKLCEYNGSAWQIIPTIEGANTWSGLQTLSAGGDVTPAAAPATNAIGYLGSPQIGDQDDYTLVMADAGKHYYHVSGSTYTLTIPANASVAYPIGTVIGIVNENGGGNLTLAITSDTLRWGSSTGSRTIAANGTASLLKVAATVWRLTGEGIS